MPIVVKTKAQANEDEMAEALFKWLWKRVNKMLLDPNNRARFNGQQLERLTHGKIALAARTAAAVFYSTKVERVQVVVKQEVKAPDRKAQAKW